MTEKEQVEMSVDGRKDFFTNASDMIWGFAETRYEEHQSAQLLSDLLEKEGFTITKNVAGIATAFRATYGNGEPVIGILGEYDALSNMSQKAGIDRREPMIEGGNGHGCGHHLLGVGSMAAAIAIKDYIEKHHIPGTICYMGCPAEEGGSGKTIMAGKHAFDHLDVALTWHPNNVNSTLCCGMLANIQAYFKFYGISSHAGLTPHLGRSALDAVELMNVGANYLREHIIPEARLHYAITNSGGISPNIVPARADVLYKIRAPKLDQVREIFARLENIAKGAALMTGTHVEVEFDKATSDIVINETICHIMHEKMKDLGAPAATEQDISFAKEIVATLSKEEQASAFRFIGPDLAKSHKNEVTAEWINHFQVIDQALPGSSDVGDVSWNVPTGQFVTACFAMGTSEHSWQLVSQGKTDYAHKGMLYAAKILALTGIELLTDNNKLEAAKHEFKERTNGATYICPIPCEE